MELFKLAAPLMAIIVPSLDVWAAEPGAGSVLELGVAHGEPGETVKLPVYLTFADPVVELMTFFEYDPERLRFLRYSVEGSAAAGVSPFGMDYQVYVPGEAVGGFRITEGTRYAIQIAPGERRHLGQLEFQVLPEAAPGEASVTPVEGFPQHTVGTTVYSVIVNGVGRAVPPERMVAGSVRVDAPRGPRPLSDVHCGQFLDRIEISFRPTEPYDAIEVSRGGRTVGTLPGSATAFSEPQPGLGAYSYSLVARAGGRSSLPIRCAIQAVAPSAPPPVDFACSERRLSWTNPVPFDRVSVFRDGDLLVQLPGGVESFMDGEPSPDHRVYTITGELAGFRSPEVHCLDPQVWMMEVGDVEAPLDSAEIEVPIYVTTSSPVQAIGLCLDIDSRRFGYLRDRERALAGTDGYPEPEQFFMGGIGACGHPALAILYDYFAPTQPEKYLPVGLRQMVVKYLFKPLGTFQEGETFPVSLLVDVSAGQTVFSIPPAVSVRPQVLIPGRIRMGSPEAGAIRHLEARRGPGGGAAGRNAVVLAWENTSAYEGIRIERNGAPLAEVSGSATSHLDPEVPAGLYVYKVSAVAGGRATFPASVVFNSLRAPGTFLRGDSNGDRRIDIADVVTTLAFLFTGGRPLPCDDAADSDDSGLLDLNDAVFTLRYVFLGGMSPRAPGTARPWFDPTPDGLTCLE
jgi:hypothetical protein